MFRNVTISLKDGEYLKILTNIFSVRIWFLSLKGSVLISVSLRNIIGTFLGHTFKNIEGKKKPHKNFSYEKIWGLFGFISKKKLLPSIARVMLPVIYEYPDMEFGSVLTSIDYKKHSMNELIAPVDFLYQKFRQIRYSENEKASVDWLMGQLHRQAIGNVELTHA